MFAAFPVLYLLGQNLQDADVHQALPSLAAAVSLTVAVWALLRLAMGGWERAALAASVLALLMMSYGYVYTALADGALRGVARHRTLLPIWGILGVGGVILAVRGGSWLARATRILNVTASALVAINLAPIVSSRLGAPPGELPGSGVERSVPTKPPASRPDIYYLIFDRYGREDVLRRSYGFDNSPFLRSLERRGFYVADKSHSNYPKTTLSVASSLAMDHLLELAASIGPNSSDASPLRRTIRNNVAARYLKRLGYRYLNIGSWWGPTSHSPIADENISYGGLSEFATVFYETTAIAPISNAISGDLDFRRREYRRVRFQFDQLEHTVSELGPKFVFAHVLSPHDPYVIDSQGRFVTEEAEARRGEGKSYLEQVRYVNSRILRLLARLQTGKKDPVVILQSDEGPGATPGRFQNVRPEVLRRKLSILNAYALPEVDDPGLYPSITPVNSLRVVFNAYFDARLPRLPDRTYVFRRLKDLYTFRDVTAELSP